MLGGRPIGARLSPLAAEAYEVLPSLSRGEGARRDNERVEILEAHINMIAPFHDGGYVRPSVGLRVSANGSANGIWRDRKGASLRLESELRVERKEQGEREDPDDTDANRSERRDCARLALRQERQDADHEEAEDPRCKVLPVVA